MENCQPRDIIPDLGQGSDKSIVNYKWSHSIPYSVGDIYICRRLIQRKFHMLLLKTCTNYIDTKGTRSFLHTSNKLNWYGRKIFIFPTFKRVL